MPFLTTPKPIFHWPQLLQHPNIPKPLHGLNPRTILGEEWWDVTRQEVYTKNNYCCWACGVHKSDALYKPWIEAHECYQIDYMKGRAELKLVAGLCWFCHNYIHNGRLMSIESAGGVPKGTYEDVMKHGQRVINESKTWPSELDFLLYTIESELTALVKDRFTPEWSDWRLVINGKEYPPIHKSYKEWARFYGELDDTDKSI